MDLILKEGQKLLPQFLHLQKMFQYPHFIGKKTETQGGELSYLKSQQRWGKVVIEALVWVQNSYYFRPPSCHVHGQLALPLTPGDMHWPLSLYSTYNFFLPAFFLSTTTFFPCPKPHNQTKPDLMIGDHMDGP